ncbi:MAG: hypothetical protein AB1696_16350 [Planctomycetota bacterium]
MQEIIKHMLEVEGKAKSIVQAAETTAQEMRIKAEEDAQGRLRQIRQEAQNEANRIVEAAREEAQRQKQAALNNVQDVICRLREQSKTREDEAIRVVADALLAD